MEQHRAGLSVRCAVPTWPGSLAEFLLLLWLSVSLAAFP
jgi:hypothetical protein